MQKNNNKIKYDYTGFNPQTLDSENIDRLALEEVPFGSLVLDIGCATGFMGEYLFKKKKCFVYGIDNREGELVKAKKRLTKAILLDIEKEGSVKNILKESKSEKFDVILATSVIEHLRNPSLFLENCKKLLKPQGIIIVSTPNIAHWTIRLSLLRGNFNYEEYGILDNTHLHLFTIKTFCQLFEKNRYKIKELLIDSVGGGYPRISKFFSKWFPGIFAYQILIVARNSD